MKLLTYPAYDPNPDNNRYVSVDPLRVTTLVETVIKDIKVTKIHTTSGEHLVALDPHRTVASEIIGATRRLMDADRDNSVKENSL